MDRMSLLPETIKELDKVYEAILFQTLDIKQQRTVILRNEEKNEVSTISLYCTVLREVLEFGIGRGIQVEPSSLLELKRWN